MHSNIPIKVPQDYILEYIEDFVNNSDSTNTIHLFTNGYCYAFAQILQATFGNGEICWVAPYSHIVWVYDNIPYDINGIYQGESTMFIPESYLGESITGFKHLPGYLDTTTKDDIDKIINTYLNDRKQDTTC